MTFWYICRINWKYRTLHKSNWKHHTQKKKKIDPSGRRRHKIWVCSKYFLKMITWLVCSCTLSFAVKYSCSSKFRLCLWFPIPIAMLCILSKKARLWKDLPIILQRSSASEIPRRLKFFRIKLRSFLVNTCDTSIHGNQLASASYSSWCRHFGSSLEPCLQDCSSRKLSATFPWRDLFVISIKRKRSSKTVHNLTFRTFESSCQDSSKTCT